jgi:hypothetical protein
MNKGGYKTEVYRAELLDLSLGGARDATWILDRTNALITQRLNQVIRDAPRTPLSTGIA